jgi:hypothetical protein
MLSTGFLNLFLTHVLALPDLCRDVGWHHGLSGPRPHAGRGARCGINAAGGREDMKDQGYQAVCG